MRESILIITLFLTIVGCGENRSYSAKKKEVQVITLDSSLLVKEINDYKIKVDSIKFDLDSLQRDVYESAEGGIVRSFYNQSDTLKKEVVYYGETGKRMLEIYQKQGKSVLIKDVLISYTEPINVDKDVEIRDSITNVYYLDSQQNLIYWIKDNQVMPSSQYVKQEKEIIKQ